MRSLLLITLFIAVTPCANAQRMASPHLGRVYRRGGHERSFVDPLAFADPFYADYLSSPDYPVAAQPPVIILQAPSPAIPTPDPAPSASQLSAQPVMIELQGDRYVQVTGEEASRTQTVDRPWIVPTRGAPHWPEGSPDSSIHPVAAKHLAPAVLVFRDGHREEVSDYTIADGVLYTRADYYTDGSWNRRIELSSLNLPATLSSNQSRGVQFQLPSAPNEVIVRP